MSALPEDGYDPFADEEPALRSFAELKEPSLHSIRATTDILECLRMVAYWRERAEVAEIKLRNLEKK